MRLIHGDCLDVLPTLADGSVDAVVCDPPYALIGPRSGMSGMRPRTEAQKAARRGGFMGKAWDRELPGIPHWQAVLRTLKPGGYLLAFGGTRTYHRLTCAIEDAGFEIRDCLMWLYGTGFPKGQGCLKPAWEGIVLARRPGAKVLPLGIDECRIPTADSLGGGHSTNGQQMSGGWRRPWMDDPEAVEANAARSRDAVAKAEELGRYPANLILGDDEAAAMLDEQSGETTSNGGKRVHPVDSVAYGKYATCGRGNIGGLGDTGGASRFFYCAKASSAERGDGNHPTVKPVALMRWLVKLVCPPGGVVLDPFAGSFTTGVACVLEDRDFIGIEMDASYVEMGRRRIVEAQGPLFAEVS